MTDDDFRTRLKPSDEELQTRFGPKRFGDLSFRDAPDAHKFGARVEYWLKLTPGQVVASDATGALDQRPNDFWGLESRGDQTPNIWERVYDAVRAAVGAT